MGNLSLKLFGHCPVKLGPEFDFWLVKNYRIYESVKTMFVFNYIFFKSNDINISL